MPSDVKNSRPVSPSGIITRNQPLPLTGSQ